VPPTVAARLQARAVRQLSALPRPLRRMLAGRPPRQAGRGLALDAQLLLRLQRLFVTSPVDAALSTTRAAMARSGYVLGGRPVGPVRTSEVVVPGPAGAIAATLYTPDSGPQASALLLYFHGGGWVAGSRESHDSTARFLAHRSGVQVLLPEYRLAPEHVFPAAVDDAMAAFAFAHAQAGRLRADPARIAVGGDSAGGNLAAVVAQLSRGGAESAAYQLLLYPNLDASTVRRSHEAFGEGFVVTRAELAWALDHYAPAGVDRADPRLSPLLGADLRGLPPAFIAVPGFDLLRDEALEYARRLREAGVPTTVNLQPDLTHGYASMLGLGQRFREATAEAADALRAALAR